MCTPETYLPLNLGFSFMGQANLVGVSCLKGNRVVALLPELILVHWELGHMTVTLPYLELVHFCKVNLFT